MFERAVIPNEVRDLTNGDGSRNEICVSKASSGGSFGSLWMSQGVFCVYAV
jgi:hypothetical protein